MNGQIRTDGGSSYEYPAAVFSKLLIGFLYILHPMAPSHVFQILGHCAMPAQLGSNYRVAVFMQIFAQEPYLVWGRSPAVNKQHALAVSAFKIERAVYYIPVFLI